jgi:hypothetical protein
MSKVTTAPENPARRVGVNMVPLTSRPSGERAVGLASRVVLPVLSLGGAKILTYKHGRQPFARHVAFGRLHAARALQSWDGQW